MFNEFFTLRELNLGYCGIDPLLAPSLSILVEKSCKFIPTLILRGNPFGAFGLGEIGAGLCRAAIDLSQDEASLASLTAAQPCNTASGNLPPSASKESVQSEKPESAADQPVTQVENTGDEGLEAKPPIVEAPVEDVYVPLEPILPFNPASGLGSFQLLYLRSAPRLLCKLWGRGHCMRKSINSSS